MRAPFRARHGRLEVSIDDHARDVVARLLVQVADLLEDGGTAVSSDPLAALVGMDDPGDDPDDPRLAAPPDDPAVARLLPAASHTDAPQAEEFRRLTERGLRQRKQDGLRLAAEALRRPEPVVLLDAEPAALLKGLTDIRLVLGERLGLRTDDDAIHLHHIAAASEPHEALAAVHLYDYLTELQEALVRALSSRRA